MKQDLPEWVRKRIWHASIARGFREATAAKRQAMIDGDWPRLLAANASARDYKAALEDFEAVWASLDAIIRTGRSA